MNKVVNELTTEIDDYARIAVAFSYKKTQQEKKDAFDSRFQDLNTRQQQLVIETQNKMRQFGELGLKQRDSGTDDGYRQTSAGGAAGAGSQ